MAVRRVAAIVVLAFAVVAAGVAGATAENYMRDAKHNDKVAIRGCVIRFDERAPDGSVVPRIHANSAHYCVGVSRIAVEEGDLVIYSDTPGKIMTVIASPDETIARMGYTCGASGGGYKTVVRCYDRDGTKVDADSPEMYGPYSNLWMTWFTWQDQ